MIVFLSILALLGLLYFLVLMIAAWVLVRPIRVPIFLSPGSLGLPQERLDFESKDGVPLRGWWIHREEPKSVVVLAHGYLMNRAECVPLAKRMFERGCACLLFDFRCHGLSGGKRSTIGWNEANDVAAAVEQARLAYPNTPIWVWGSSMGGAASTFALSQHRDLQAKALVLDSVYGRLSDTNSGWWKTFIGKWGALLRPVMGLVVLLTGLKPKKVVVSEHLENLKELPILIMHGGADILVPPVVAEANQRASGGELHLFDGCQHSQPRWLMTPQYDAILEAFLDRNGL